ncbi:hypothetical protein ACFQZE_02295 [Paenibacillus sp. GCM10027627]|uniref:hypothetical protein n=1 Tax=unclassified Paenibacillus TaxID=185978 RepID=UPI00363582BF
MKRIVISLTVALFVLFAAVGAVSAQEQQNQVSITDVEKLIEQKMNEEKPLTHEELTEALLDMKDEKIADLDGNVSKTIDLFALFVGITAFVLAAVTGFIGWLIKRSIDDKLAKIDEKETNINQKHSDIQSKVGTIEEYYKEVKKFRDDLEKFNNRLDSISEATEKSNKNLKGLREYVSTIESVTDSTALMFKFLDESAATEGIVEETREVLQLPQKNLRFVLQKLEPKLKMEGRLNKVEDVTEQLEYLANGLSEYNNNLWNKFKSFKGIQKLHSDTDESMMKFNEEVEDCYENWKDYLKDIEAIKEHWEAHRRMNPVRPPADPPANC